jgi:hypothetical protein
MSGYPQMRKKINSRKKTQFKDCRESEKEKAPLLAGLSR